MSSAEDDLLVALREQVEARSRGGSKRGRRYHKIKRADGDELRRRNFRLLDSEFSALKRLGAGNATEGIRAVLRRVKPQRKS